MHLRHLIVPSLCALAIACKPAPQGQAAATSAPTAASTAPPPAAAKGPAPVPEAPRKIHVEDKLFTFDYAYPAAAAAIPALGRQFDSEATKGHAELSQAAREGAADARAAGFPYRPYARETRWQVVTDLPGWLSLSANIFEDSGGAHPNHGYAALLWDKAAGRKRNVSDLFVSRAALSAAIRKPFCDVLDKERAKRRGAPVDRASGDEFDACIDPVGSTLILGSSNRRSFDRIGVLVGPYEAGPYAEGDYDVTLPVTPAVLAVVRPEYRAVFSASR